MKLNAVLLLSCVVATASYAPHTLAVECSAAQQASANVLGADAEFQKSCPDVFDDKHDGSATLDVASVSGLTASSLAVLAPCQKGTCAAYLKKKAGAVPDCEISGVNARLVFNTIVDFCANSSSSVGSGAPGSLGSGSLSDAKFIKVDGSSSGSSAGSITKPSTISSTPAASTAAPTVGDKASDAKTPDAATKANTKSGATTATFASVAAVVAGALLSVLCM